MSGSTLLHYTTLHVFAEFGDSSSKKVKDPWKGENGKEKKILGWLTILIVLILIGVEKTAQKTQKKKKPT